MVTPEGEVKVLDFGIARSLSDPGVVLALAPALPDPFDRGRQRLPRTSWAPRPSGARRRARSRPR